jgi:hypothetical protein
MTMPCQFPQAYAGSAGDAIGGPAPPGGVLIAAPAVSIGPASLGSVEDSAGGNQLFVAPAQTAVNSNGVSVLPVNAGPVNNVLPGGLLTQGPGVIFHAAPNP